MKSIHRVISVFIVSSVFLSALAEDSVDESDNLNKVQEQVLQALNLAGGSKAVVTEFFLDMGKMPVDNYEAGLTDSFNINSSHVDSVTGRDGTITITFGGQAAPELSGLTLDLVPLATNERIFWSCVAAYIEDRFLPGVCKSS